MFVTAGFLKTSIHLIALSKLIRKFGNRRCVFDVTASIRISAYFCMHATILRSKRITNCQIELILQACFQIWSMQLTSIQRASKDV